MSSPTDGDPAQRRLDGLKAQLGTSAAPFVQQLENGRIPLNEFATHGYETLAFPTLSPFGRRLEPTVVNIKPRLPRKLLTSKAPQERQEYCRVQLLLHRPFSIVMITRASW